MALDDELDLTIRKVHEEAQAIEAQIEALRRTLAQRRLIEADALRLYRSTTGSTHPYENSRIEEPRESPRASQVMAFLEAAGGPVTLAELIEAMPDKPERGAISAVVHRAVRKGDVRRLRRGVYELAGRFARAS